jgi:HlyD family secretion protein
MRGEVGEQLLPGAAIVQLGDLASWQIETEDLVELDVVRVRVGAPVRVTIDALPGVQLTGKVVHIKLIGENKIGDMTYTVSIQLDQATAELAWNMTATVYITGNE